MQLRGRRLGITLIAIGGICLGVMYWAGILPQKSHGHLPEFLAVIFFAVFHFGVVRTFQRFQETDSHKSRPILRACICGSAGYVFARICAFHGAEPVFVLCMSLLGLLGRHARPYGFSAS